MPPSADTPLKAALAAVPAAPLEPKTHERLGDAWVGLQRPLPAVACYRTAMALGGEEPPLLVLKLALAELAAGCPQQAEDRLRAVMGRTDGVLREQMAQAAESCAAASPVPLGDRDHNRRYRMESLAMFLTGTCGREDFQLLDVGGGDGLLSLHLPHAGYRLAEPDINGLRGEALPFPPRSVDVVCACHVLEHVPPEARFDFLDALRDRAREHLVLLNPFHVPGSGYRERLQTVIDLTGADWAREHLACGLPETALISEYAAARGLTFTMEPNGAIPTAFLANLVSHYARKAGCAAELARINRYLNSLDPQALTNPRLPAAMLVHFPLI